MPISAKAPEAENPMVFLQQIHEQTVGASVPQHSEIGIQLALQLLFVIDVLLPNAVQSTLYPAKAVVRAISSVGQNILSEELYACTSIVNLCLLLVQLQHQGV